MDNIVSIDNTKKNTLEFDLTIDGVDVKKVKAALMVKSRGMSLAFDAKYKDGSTWSVTLPKLPMLDRTAYKFIITVIADGYYFEPFKGTLNVVGPTEIYSSEPKNVTLEPENEKKTRKPSTKKSTKPETKNISESWKSREKPIDQIAKELLEQQEAIVEEKSTTTNKNAVTNKDEKVHAILGDLGIDTKIKKRRRFSLM